METDSSGAGRWVGITVVVATFLAGATLFLPLQSLWLDEATQLTGLGLGPVSAVRWLAGGEMPDSGQFADRMPPGSYWLGWTWGRIFGPGEVSLRWFGVCCVAIASTLVFEGARRAFGAASGWAAGLIFATSPSVVAMSVEIRAYPLFLLESAAAFALLIRLAESRSGHWAWFASLGVVLASAMATHFYGFALACAVGVAMAWLTIRRGWRLAPLVVTSVLLGLTALALSPFVRAVVGRTRAMPLVPITVRLECIAKFVPNLIDHPTLMVFGPVQAGVMAGFLVLACLAIRSRSKSARAVALALVAGLGAVALVELCGDRGRFRICSPNYNLWTKSALCLLASAGLAASGRTTRWLAVVASGVLIASQGFGVFELVASGEHFGHGPHRTIALTIVEFGPSNVAVVIDGDREPSHFIACPIRYDFGPDLDQFRQFSRTNPSEVVPLRGDPTPRRVESLTHRYLIVIRPLNLGDKDLARQVRSGDRPIDLGPIGRGPDVSIARRQIRQTLHVAHIAARIDVYERTF